MAECSPEELVRALTDHLNFTCPTRGDAIGLTVGVQIFNDYFKFVPTLFPIQLTFIDNHRSGLTFLGRYSGCMRNHRGMLFQPGLIGCYRCCQWADTFIA